MSTVNTSTTAVNSTFDTAAQSFGAATRPQGSHVGIMALVNEIIKIDSKVRNTEYQYSIEQQQNSYNESMDAYHKQKDAAAKHAKQGILDAAGSMVSGGAMLGLGGLGHYADEGFSKVTRTAKKKAFNSWQTGDLKGLNDALEEGRFKIGHMLTTSDESLSRLYDSRHRHLAKITNNGELTSGLVTAPFKIGSAHIGTGASSDERLADLDKNVEKYFEKDADTFSQHARSVSSDMRQAINSLVQIQAKLCDAVNIR